MGPYFCAMATQSLPSSTNPRYACSNGSLYMAYSAHSLYVGAILTPITTTYTASPYYGCYYYLSICDLLSIFSAFSLFLTF